MKHPLPVVSRLAPLVLVMLAYCALLGALMARIPLWLDEVLQLMGTASASASDALLWSARNTGGVPLGFLAQWASVQCFGQSALAARLPSAIAALLCALLLLSLCRSLALPRPSLALILFLLLPLQLRYAVEARPYSLALLFTLGATQVLLLLLAQPRIYLWILYLFLAIAALYTQPFAFFLMVAHVVWLARENMRLAVRVALILAVALTLFAPWYIFAEGEWRQTMASAGTSFHFEPKTLLMMIREISGGGYALSVPLLALAIWGACSPALTRSVKLLLGSTVLVPPICAIAADAWFGYFFAIRQVLFVVPGLVILAAEGLRLLAAAHPRLGAAALAAVLLVSAASDWKRIRKKGENWALAASVLQLATEHRACALVAPESQLRLYAYFEPGLLHRECARDLTREDVIVAATSPYTTPLEDARWWSRVHMAGFTTSYRTRAGGSTIYVLRRQPPDILTRWRSQCGPLTAKSSPLTAYLRTFSPKESILTTADIYVIETFAVPSRRRRTPFLLFARSIDGQCGHDQWRRPGSIQTGGSGRPCGDLEPHHRL